MSAVSAYSDELGLSGSEQRLLRHLLDEADDEGVIEGFNLTRCASEMKLGAGSGRRTLGRWLAGLADAGIVVYERARSGTALGFVQVVESGRLRSESSARQRALSARCDPDAARVSARCDPDAARVSAPLARAATPNPARVSTPSARAVQPRHKEQDSLAVRQLASELEGTQPTDWQPDELPELLRPLLDFCARCSPPLVGMTNRAGTLRALRPYRRAQVEHAVRAVLAETKTGGVHKPIGLLTAMAKTAAPEYFTVAADRPTAPPVADGQDPAGVVDPRAAITAARQALGRPA